MIDKRSVEGAAPGLPPSATSPWPAANGRISWCYAALLAFVITAAASNVLEVAADLPLLDEIGYGDSYILYDTQQYARTGVIYRDLDQAPHNPSLYSPALYVLLSWPLRILPASNPFLGPRLIVCAFFAGCVLISASITRKLARHPLAVVWSILLGSSIGVFNVWITQIRSDFIGICFSLFSIRLLLNRSRWMGVAAGAAAGMAFAFKLTFVATVVSGFGWLLWRRHVGRSVEFLVSAMALGFGVYLGFQRSEPLMFTHLTTFLKTPIIEYRVYATIVGFILREPAFLLALSALPFAVARSWRRWDLLLLYACSSLLIALVTARQAGANVNYFFELLFALVPLASVGAIRLQRVESFRGVPDLFLAGLITLLLLKPTFTAMYDEAKRLRPGEIHGRNGKISALGNVLKDKRVFATAPRVAILTRDPPVTEPFLLSYLEIIGKFSPGPLSERVEEREFDVVVTYAHRRQYRGVERLSPSFRKAIQSAYAPFCVYEGSMFHLPQGQADPNSLREDLRKIGCMPISDLQRELLFSW